MSNAPCPRCGGSVDRRLQIMPDSMCAYCQLQQIVKAKESEAEALRKENQELRGQIERDSIPYLLDINRYRREGWEAREKAVRMDCTGAWVLEDKTFADYIKTLDESKKIPFSKLCDEEKEPAPE